jgi:Flp pilus assembly protein TadG
MMRIRHLLRDEKGSSLIEIAACLTALLMLSFGVIDCSRALYADLYVGYSAHAAARYAMVRGSTWNGTTCSDTTTASCDATNSNVTSYVQSMAPLGIDTTTPLKVATAWPGTTAAGSSCMTSNGANSPGCVVQVAVTYNFTFVLPFLPKSTLALKSSSAVTIAQ